MDEGGRVDAGEVVGVERIDLVLGFGGWPVWMMRLVGRATVLLVVVVIVIECFSWRYFPVCFNPLNGCLSGYRGPEVILQSIRIPAKSE